MEYITIHEPGGQSRDILSIEINFKSSRGQVATSKEEAMKIVESWLDKVIANPNRELLEKYKKGINNK